MSANRTHRLKFTPEAVFTALSRTKLDGRVLTPIVEQLLAENMGLNLDAVAGGGRVLTGFLDKPARVRALGEKGVILAEMRWFGTKREDRYSNSEFLDGLKTLSGFFVYDSMVFPETAFWFINSADVQDWLKIGLVSKGKMTRKNFLLQMEAE